MPIKGEGWELHVERLGLHLSGARKRTYGRYQVYRNGQPVAGLAGNICESMGPGDNSTPGNGLRVQAGRYPLWTQFGRYRSIGYSTNMQVPADPAMPGIRLEGTGNRVGILIHPGHPPKLFLSSVGCLNPTNALQPNEVMNYWDSRARVIAMLDDLRDFAPKAFAHEAITRISDAWAVIDHEPMNVLTATPPRPVAAIAGATTPAPEPVSLPISRSSAIACAKWLTTNFGAALSAATVGKAYGVKHLCAIVCQETAYKWIKWKDDLTPAQILAACVFDASGDYPGASRSAFPVNTAAFRQAYGPAFTDMLIEEANKARRIQGWSDAAWVYKGYGIFQYDLQHVTRDRAFFEQKQWYDFDSCLARCCAELDTKLRATGGDLWKAIKAYNGSGARATRYAENVKVFTTYCATVTGD